MCISYLYNAVANKIEPEIVFVTIVVETQTIIPLEAYTPDSKSFNVSNGELELSSNNKKIVLLTYVIFNDYFRYSTNLTVDPEAEYLCNSETEFLEKVQEAKLINIISQ